MAERNSIHKPQLERVPSSSQPGIDHSASVLGSHQTAILCGKLDTRQLATIAGPSRGYSTAEMIQDNKRILEPRKAQRSRRQQYEEEQHERGESVIVRLLTQGSNGFGSAWMSLTYLHRIVCELCDLCG
jgi:hypothetical protein